MIRIILGAAIAAALSAMVLVAPVAAQTVPNGSYQQSCRDVAVRGNGVLVATCTAANGQWVNSRLDIASCRRDDIANINGQLTCARYNNGNYNNGNYNSNDRDRDWRNRGERGYSGNNGYGNNGYNTGRWALPGGSYTQSCDNTAMRGRMLTASCTASNGSRVTSSLDVSRCRQDSDIANINGRLECMRYR
jgi:hypothetical protein